MRILIKGVEMARYELPSGQELAIPNAEVRGGVEGTPTKDPAFGSGGVVDSHRPRARQLDRRATRWWTR